MAGGGADDGYNVSLQVVEVVEQHGTVGKAHALAGAVVEEAHNGIPGLLRQNLAAVEEEFRGGAVDCLAGADTVSVVLVAVGIAAIGDLPQLPAHPGVAGAVVAGHVADAEEGGAGREIVRRGVGIGRGAGDTTKMVAQKRGLVHGVVPVLKPVAGRAVHPGGAAQGVVGVDVAPAVGEVPVTPQLPDD